ncbi:MAG: hypothetical protein KGZ81_16385 [Flavobacteriales bacterium]|nr:hypothetical protein [Flavobacteriales bacterium]MBS4042168.1 hypothetical protein [Flavobacteriales bacterium]
MDHRFQDKKYRLADFHKEVAVRCPSCHRKAIATVDYEQKKAKMICSYCGHLETKETLLNHLGMLDYFETSANVYFDAELWYLYPFKDDYFFAYNHSHLIYLEQYIGSKLREHKNRTHFTLLEKLPKFYHEAKNRESLLKLIEKLKRK